VPGVKPQIYSLLAKKKIVKLAYPATFLSFFVKER
jgi:hypothetical protein